MFNYLAGSLARVFTTLQEVDDKLILYGFVAGFALNAVLAAQMVYYWNSSTEVVVEKKKQEKDVGALREKIAVGDSSGVQTKVKSPTTRRRG